MIKLELTPTELDLVNLALNVYRENLQYDDFEEFSDLENATSEVVCLINKLEAV